MIWTFAAGAAVVLLQQYHLMYRRLGPGHTGGLIVLDGLVLFVGQVALAVWLGMELHWYALAFLLVFVFGPILIPIGVRTPPETLMAFRWPVGLLIVATAAALWSFSNHGLRIALAGRAANSMEANFDLAPQPLENTATVDYGPPLVSRHPSPDDSEHPIENFLQDQARQSNNMAMVAANTQDQFDREQLLNELQTGMISQERDANQVSTVNVLSIEK